MNERKKCIEMKNKTNTIIVPVKIEEENIDTVLQKAKELVSLLERANKLIQSLGNTTINNYTN